MNLKNNKRIIVIKKKQKNPDSLRSASKYTGFKFFVMAISLMFSIQVNAQTDTLSVPSDVPDDVVHPDGNLNNKELFYFF